MPATCAWCGTYRKRIDLAYHNGTVCASCWQSYKGIAPCPTCAYRALHYPGAGPCDAHSGDVWPSRKDN